MNIGALLIALALLVANGFFVAAEFALMAARRTRLEELAGEGNTRARMALRSNRELSFTLAGAQLGVTMASLGLGFVAEPAVAHLLESGLGLTALPEAVAEATAFVIGLLIVVFVHMVIGEMVPKNIAIAAPERAALWIAVPMTAYCTLFRPVIRLLNAAANGVLRVLRVEPVGSLATAATGDELATMVAASRAEGMLDEVAEQLLSGALRFGEDTPATAMVPRDRMRAVAASTTPGELEALVVASGHSRFPVYAGTVDHVIGYVHAKSLLDVSEEERDQPLPSRLIRPLLHVPAPYRLRALLTAMRSRRTHIALVVDGTGAALGLITLEDVLEQLVGAIRDEHDPQVDTA
jgi:CBS domain containing-hemolysin-like protein